MDLNKKVSKNIVKMIIKYFLCILKEIFYLKYGTTKNKMINLKDLL